MPKLKLFKTFYAIRMTSLKVWNRFDRGSSGPIGRACHYVYWKAHKYEEMTLRKGL